MFMKWLYSLLLIQLCLLGQNALQARGFTVIYKENANKRDMKKLVKQFTYQLKKGGVGLYYFAGHGVNVNGQISVRNTNPPTLVGGC